MVEDQSVDYVATHVGKNIPRRGLQSCTDLRKKGAFLHPELMYIYR
jgi:hypothetical protein